MTNNILIVGKTGFIASALGAFLEKGHNNRVSYTSSSIKKDAIYLNLENIGLFNYESIDHIDVVYMLAGISSPDFCENNIDLCKEININGTKKFIKNCLLRGKKVVFSSSDVVYGQQKNMVNEFIATNPIGRYALMKKEIEESFKGNANFKAVRFSYVYSKDDKFTKYLYECKNSNSVAEIYHPLERSVISLKDVIIALSSLPKYWDKIDNPFINFGGRKLVSRLDIANTIKQYCLPQLEFKVLTPPDSFYYARPETIYMKSTYMTLLLQRKPQALDEMVTENCQ